MTDDDRLDLEDVDQDVQEWTGPVEPEEFCRIIATGTRREQLCAIRDRLADMLSTATAGVDVSSLALRLRQTLDDIDSCPDPGALPAHDEAPKSVLDELASRRGTKNAPRRQNTSGRRRRSNR